MAAYYPNGNLIPGTLETISKRTICPKCKREYIENREEQVIGFRERSENVCPYCGYVLGSSMEWDYNNTAENFTV